MIHRTKVAGRILEVLQIEDNKADTALLKQVLKGAGFPVHLSSVENGEEAMSFLRQQAPYSQSPLPNVILLDLQLPRKDGLTVLTEIRREPEWARLPIIIFTSSESDLDKEWSGRLRADHFLVKPLELDHYGPLLKVLREYWLKSFRERPLA
ncbi:MAG TPA: response regulator [bacterium]|nr:response regulator [bacterium]